MKNKYLFIICIVYLSISCGVKSDVIPPAEPWVIFENSKKQMKTKETDNTKKKGAKKDVSH